MKTIEIKANQLYSPHQAAEYLKSSPNFVRACVKDGRLQGRTILQKTRPILRVTGKSLLILKPTLIGNKKVGREALNPPQRKPLISRGYRYIFSPTHINANVDGYVAEHRLVMEAHLGRVLSREQSVHHLNNKRGDNRLENLSLKAPLPLEGTLFSLLYEVAKDPLLEQKAIAYLTELLNP